MRTFFTGLALACLAHVGCMSQESLSPEEVLKANPTPEQFVKRDSTKRAPQPETCLEAGKMYEALCRDAKDPHQQRDLNWRAKQAYTQAERLRPQWPAALAGLARLSDLEGNAPSAVTYYQSCLQSCTGQNPGDGAASHEAGLFFARQKQFDLSLTALQRAMQCEPGNRSYAMNYGYTLARAGRFEESHQHFAKILSPGDAAYQVALMARHVGQTDACRRFAEQAMQAEPGKSQEAQQLIASLSQPQAGEVQQAQASTPAQ